MFKYPFSDYLWLYLIAIMVWCIIFGITYLINKTIRVGLFYFLLLAIAFSFLGLTIGINMGLSESPVIGTIIPALLTFVGGFMIYAFVFTDKSKMQDGYVLLVIMIALTFFLMVGSDYSCSMRCDFDAQSQSYLYWQKKDYDLFKDSLAKASIKTNAKPVVDTAAQNLFKAITGSK